MNPSPRAGYTLAILAALSWAATSPGLSFLLERYDIPALTLAFWRDAFIAVACLAGIGLGALISGRGLPRLSGAELRGFAATGAISVGLYHALFVTSIALNGAAMGIVLIYLFPAFVTVGARLIFKEAIGPTQVVALALAIIGCGLLVRVYDPGVLRVSWVGTLVGIVSAVAHAGYVLFNQRAMTRHSPWLSLALTMSFGSLALLALAAAVNGPASLAQVGPGLTPWMIVLGLSLGPTLAGYALFTSCLRHLPGRVASLIMVIEAPLATLAAVLLLGERLEPAQVVGMALILAAAVLPGLGLRAPGGRPAAATAD
ncbi:MAG TPA: DMT family transporter [Chloroflexaceae bacterium]|nr:DMT family transporter [Chloroflexaceae bacterium]